jgi:hypothetical protein
VEDNGWIAFPKLWKEGLDGRREAGSGSGRKDQAKHSPNGARLQKTKSTCPGPFPVLHYLHTCSVLQMYRLVSP